MTVFDTISNYIVVDVETPNSKNDSICSIAIVVVNENIIVKEEYYLVNPECSFDYFNVNLHGISKSMVLDKPTFPEIWEEINEYFTNGIVVAHNAAFDLSVVAKTLTRYSIEVPEFFYLCTFKLAKNEFEQFEKHNLKYLCDILKIELTDHHNALSDAQACQNILEIINSKRRLTSKNINVFSFKGKYIPSVEKTILTKSLTTLNGIVNGICCDLKVNEKEITLLGNWIEEYFKYKEVLPFSDIIPEVQKIINDGVVSEIEIAKLLKISKKHLIRGSINDITSNMQIFKGVIEGISCDKNINILEIVFLKHWMLENIALKGNFPYDIIFNQISDILKDNNISSEEHTEMIHTFDSFINPLEIEHDSEIILNNKVVCLSGDFSFGSKEEIGQIITDCGGQVSNSVTRNVDILVVGGEGSSKWIHCNFGTKVNKALELKSKGNKIDILREEDFLSQISRK